MRRFFHYSLIVLTILCCFPFVSMLAIYLNWRMTNPAPTTADIGLGMVILSSYLAAIPLVVWLCYGLYVFLTSTSVTMGEYFDSGRRRLGLVLLAVSCLICLGWVRSFYTTDTLSLFGGRFESRHGQIERSATTFMTVGRIGGGVTSVYWSVPYLLILSPFVLASTVLLLSNSRQSAPALPPQINPKVEDPADHTQF
jgi:hypothetical protein